MEYHWIISLVNFPHDAYKLMNLYINHDTVYNICMINIATHYVESVIPLSHSPIPLYHYL